MIPLTTREKQICALVAKGHTDKEVADLIGVTQGTVKIHLAHTYRKHRFTWGNSRVRMVVEMKEGVSE